jgi:Oxidoreductase family, NAD-binding Rossmann fold
VASAFKRKSSQFYNLRVMKTITAILLLVMPSVVSGAELRLGLVGTDTSHVVDLATNFNDPAAPSHVAGARIVAAYKGGSPDFPQSRDRIERFTSTLQQKYGVEIVGSIAELCARVDGVLLTSVDGRIHLAQVQEIAAARKPVFIDKPLATTLEDARAIAKVLHDAGVPWFSTSTLRYGVAALKKTDATGVDVWGPGPFAEHQALDLAWYGIHEAEMLYTLMGTGCEEVTRVTSPDADVVTCRWKDGRIGTMRALRPYSDYGVVQFRKAGERQASEITAVKPDPAALARDLVTFFQTRRPPVSNDETLELFAFLDAAQRSKDAGGAPARLR